ncbi:MAG: chorismate-binding protein [Flavobacteriales bacterium]|jgi:isochorismate synthase|uniref:chorismate-binding protein n=1 Tax=Blattabacterium sp. (Mastotermes darwiniensis) TaxID=39768 RepID=UPI000231DE9D|nr:chorismate-binding protein [Blattabacterium sp. (Mastotermes darwiniensis)]AER40721.1 isochorismate synthase entC [Blattabacterium sp. (Mastotermes darwiniensis) str. MADAR]MDR1804751.1 chorismate-binding protein [Flavobacteriales bacterium]
MVFIRVSITSLYKKIIKKYWKNESFVVFKKPCENRIYFYSKKNETSKIKENFFLIGSFNHDTIIRIYTDKIYFVDIENIFSIKTLINHNDFFSYQEISSFLIYSHTYKNMIKKAIEFIKNKYFKKVVLSRLMKISFHNFYLKETFQRLILSYPKAFVTLWYDFDHGLWLGASPELLMKSHGKKLKTVALAGTIPIGNNNWTKKEIEEHEIVVRYIVNFLKKHYSGILSIQKTRIMDLGTIHHLETPINFYFFKNPDYYDILYHMYPTPSICGFPIRSSLDFIQKNEECNRNFYTGYFGPVNGMNMELYLNLRCARIRMDKKEITLYAGSGITRSSNVDKEYLETENKIKNILSQFFFN